MDRFGMDRFGMDKFSPVSGRPAPVRLLPALACALSTLLAASTAAACDGKSYSFSIAAGAVVSAGGLSVRLDKAKFLDDIPDKYYISVKDDGELLADHTLLIQRDTVNLKTKCGIVSIGADRKSMFSNGTLALNWSYF
jgi:hypothetical protein